MQVFKVQGLKPLHGKIKVQGAKNAVLPMMAASLLTDGRTEIRNVPRISDVFLMAEILREKLLLCLDKEIPHGTAVEITKFSERDSGVIDVDATIYCEKASHKGIIIGKQGAMLKKISSLARQDMEKFMGTKVYLETWVKVKENWRDNVNYVRSFGYRDE